MKNKRNIMYVLTFKEFKNKLNEQRSNDSISLPENRKLHPTFNRNVKDFASLLFDYLSSNDIKWTLNEDTRLGGGSVVLNHYHVNIIRLEGLPIVIELISVRGGLGFRKYGDHENTINIYLESDVFSKNVAVDNSFQIVKAAIDKYLNGDDSKLKVIEFLKNFKIKKYKVNDDLSVDILEPIWNGMTPVAIDLSDLNLTEIPIKFNTVVGNFICSRNKLRNLKNSPTEIISGDLIASDNELSTLEGATEIFSKLPEEVTSVTRYRLRVDNNKLTDFSNWNLKKSNSRIAIYAANNKITSIPGNFPFESVYRFVLGGNEIKDISNIPGDIISNSSFENNKIEVLPIYSEFRSADFVGNPINTIRFMAGSYQNLDLSNMGLSKIENMPPKVRGSLNVSGNNLTSLKGFPKVVEGSFDCSNNQLVSLEGGPISVGSDYDCYNNRLVSLEGAPKKLKNGSFNCSNNQLTSLKGGPEMVTHYYNCSHNLLENMEGLAYIVLPSYFNRYASGTDIILVINDNKINIRKRDVIEYFKNLPMDNEIFIGGYVDRYLIKYLKVNVKRDWM